MILWVKRFLTPDIDTDFESSPSMPYLIPLDCSCIVLYLLVENLCALMMVHLTFEALFLTKLLPRSRQFLSGDLTLSVYLLLNPLLPFQTLLLSSLFLKLVVLQFSC